MPDQSVQALRLLRKLEVARKQAITRLDKIRGADQEVAHNVADQVLLDFARAVSPGVADAFERCRAATGPWWYA